MAKLDVLTGMRFKHTYRQEEYYFNIFPGEIFISSAAEKDQLTAAAIDYMARATSLLLQTIGKEDTLEQLRKASHSCKDMPGILAALIEENIDD